MRYDRSYDDPLRGPRGRGAAYDRDLDDRRWWPRTPRVSARYNMDYVTDRPEPLERNPNPYAGRPGVPVGGRDAYVRPYLTTGGTETFRGSDRPLDWARGRGDSRPQGHGSSRPWVGGYRAGYQGGSGGIRTGTGGYDRDYPRPPRRAR